MHVRCAWHKEVIGEKPPFDDYSITDTICDKCLLEYFPNVYEKIHGNIPLDELPNNKSIGEGG